MNVTRHFSDTRTDSGRVRILVQSGLVVLDVEGPGWHHRSTHVDLSDATLELAWLPQVSGALYAEALQDLSWRLRVERSPLDLPGAA
ncbi:hypothetical protein LAJ19_08275 [Deinococcus taeanensis]|uniref:hypothetical protein n=1 Tax=Deinococcus taeanensis TaxID=2737050 RepID=UPI001CDC7239|nr:hypothetical protein [Deinococcus taeanensis]UBV41656.1 hypothetical protein LAJ19_08275 [Deinococcus taeanensis]